MYKFEGKYKITKKWFALEEYWLKINLKTGNPELYKNISYENIEGQANFKFPKLSISIGSSGVDEGPI